MNKKLHYIKVLFGLCHKSNLHYTCHGNKNECGDSWKFNEPVYDEHAWETK